MVDLPEFLAEVVVEGRLALRKSSFLVKGIVYLAQSLVEKITWTSGRIEIRSQMPEREDNLDSTLGLRITEYFNLT
jgi:hypothetical protein